MLNIFKRFKISYAVYNFFHRNELVHNELQYKKLGLSKKYYSSISSKDFEGLPGSNSIIPTIDDSILSRSKLYHTLSSSSKESLLQYTQNGFAVLENYLSEEQVGSINQEIETMLKNGTVKFTNVNKIMFAIHKSILLRETGNNKDLVELLSLLMGDEAILFQSINFLMGSEQDTHSDSIHMTTYPLGGLLGVWIALEDITLENGPLHYYPKSHTLPYYMNKDYDNEGTTFMLGDKSYTEYENMMSRKIKEHQLEKLNFCAKKGDLLIWHANLLHGGNEHMNKNKTRKSMVFHYFKKDSICYHEITQRPALIKYSE
jgi:phytanoyl-CoA hydroxylase